MLIGLGGEEIITSSSLSIQVHALTYARIHMLSFIAEESRDS